MTEHTFVVLRTIVDALTIHLEDGLTNLLRLTV